MKRFLIPTLAAGLIAAATSTVSAQPLPFRPAVSPYLNIVGARNPAIGYFGIMRPQIHAAQAIGQLQAQVGQPVVGVPGQEEAGTGVVGGFQNHWGYFQTMPIRPANIPVNGGGGGMAGGVGGGLGGFRGPGGPGFGVFGGSGIGLGVGIGIRR